MPTGQFGSVVESRLYTTPSGSSAMEGYRAVDPNAMQHVSGNVYFLGSKQAPYITTFSCTAAGDLSNAALAQVDIVAAAVVSFSPAYFHVSGNVYGCVYSTSASGSRYMRCVTFSVSNDGLTVTVLADTAIGSEGYVNCCQYGLNVSSLGSNQFVYTGQALSATGDGTATLRFKFFTVSTDGLTIALVATTNYASLANTSWGGAFKHIDGDYYMFTYVYYLGYDLALTFRVVAGGTATLVDGPLTLGYQGEPTASLSINMCKISPTVWAACFKDKTSGTVMKLVTFECDSVGNLGSIIDTDTSVVPTNGVRSLQMDYFVSTFILLTHSDAAGGMAQTIAVSLDGTIGAQISALAPSSNPYFTYYTEQGDTYIMITMESSFYARSCTIVLPDPAIETLLYSDLKHDQVTLWGNITEVGVAEEYGFDWSLGSGNFENELLSSDPIIPGLFCIDLTGLTYNTAYKYRAKIGIGGTWTYGTTQYFATSFPVPQVETDPASGADDFYIDAVGHVRTDAGVQPIDSYGFVYGTKMVEDMLGRFNGDLDKDYGPDEAKADGYDSNEQVTGTLKSTTLSTSCLAGQAEVQVLNADGITAGKVFVLADDDNEEVLTVDHVVGLVVTMTTNLAHAYVMGALLGEQVTIRLRNLEYGKRYFFRFWAHNFYGYGWGGTMVALTSDTVNIMVPTATASKGIRFCVPGKINFPPTGMWYDTRHHLLVLSPDSYYVSPAEGGGGFGCLAGKYVCERSYWAEATNTDLYTMSNAVRRTGVPVKVKYKARIGNNSYGLNNYHKRVINNGSTSLTGAYMSAGAGFLAWYCEIFTVNPWTTNAWAVEETDDLKFGISIRSGTGWEQPALDCIEGRICWANAAVTTKPAKIGSDLNHVKFHALVTEDEAEDCYVYFEYGPTIAYGDRTADQLAVKGQHVYEDLAYTPPPPGTYYHYRAVIETSCGETFYGADQLYPNGLILEIAFEQSILTVSPTWTDVTAELQRLRVKQGRNHQLDKCEAGTATFIMKNASGNWWRYNTAGAYYGSAGGVKPITLIRLRRAYEGTWNVFYGEIEGVVPGWLERRGGYVPVAQLSCVDAFKSFNKYRIIDADNALTENEPVGSSHVVLSSVREYVEGQTVRLHDSAHEETLVIQQVVLGTNTIIFTTTTTYAYTVANAAKLKKWPVVLSGTRIHDICLECLWPLALTSIDAGVVEVSEISPAAGGENALSAMQSATKAEDGNLFMAGNGWLVFQAQDARTKDVSTDLYPDVSALRSSQATFKDDGTLSKFVDPEISDDDEFIYNECNITGDDIGEQLMVDSAYQLVQGPRIVPDMTGSIIHNPADAIVQAFIKVERYKDGQQRVKALTVDADADEEDLTPKVCGYELGTRVTLQINSTRNPALLNQAYHIEGRQHDWAPGEDWITKWQLWDPSKYRVFSAVHTGYLGKVDDITDYMAAHDAAAADPTLVLNDAAWPDGVRVGQWDTYAGAIWLSSLIYRGYLEFNTASLVGATYPPTKAWLLMYLQSVSLPRAWNLRLVPCSPLDNPLIDTNYHDLLGHTDDYGSIAMPSIGGQWLAIELTSSGIATISYSALTKFGMRSDKDIDADDPGTNQQEWALFDVSATLGKTPKLIVKL